MNIPQVILLDTVHLKMTWSTRDKKKKWYPFPEKTEKSLHLLAFSKSAETKISSLLFKNLPFQ